MSDEKAPKKRGCIGTFVTLVLFLGAVGLGMALYFIAQPQDLADIDGYGNGKKLPNRDMEAVLQNSLDRGYPVTLTEEQLNGWISQTLDMKQEGLLKDYVTLEGVCVRLEDSHAEVIMERKVLGRTFTVSMFLGVDAKTGMLQRDGGPYHEDFPKPLRGGRFGRLVVPQGFLLLVMPAYEQLAAAFEKEVELGLGRMAQVKLEGEVLTMEPQPADNGLVPDRPF